MSSNDPIADLLTRMRNASRARHRFLDIRHSKMKESIVKILKENHFVAHYLVKEEHKKKTMRIFLKYTAEREEIFHGLSRASKSSLRKYVSHHHIPRVLGDTGLAILSTSKGVIEGKRAKELRVGGELVCLVW